MSTTTPAVRNGTSGNGKAPAVREDAQVATIRGLLSRMGPEIRKALPKYMDPDRMLRLALTAIRSDQKLLACTPESLMGSVMKAAQVGLEIDGILGHAYLVPFYNGREKINEAQLIVGYRGYIKLARDSRQIETIQGHVVFEADEFDFAYGSKEFLHHRPARVADRGQVVGAWAMTRFRGASHPQFEFLDRATIEARRRRSKQAERGPWVSDYPAMCVKTVYRQHSKIWPLSPIVRGMIEAEELIAAGVELPPSEPTDLDAPVLEAPATRSSRLADALESRADAPAGETIQGPEDIDDWELNGDRAE